MDEQTKQLAISSRRDPVVHIDFREMLVVLRFNQERLHMRGLQ